MADSRRRWLLMGGAGAVGIAGALAYRAWPGFWRQYAREWPRPILPPPAVPDVSAWSDTGLHAAWLGHATVLIKIDGFTILTDPVFGDRCGISLGVVTLGLKRLVAPALDLGALPKIDLILLSHAHMDHTDIPSLRRLESRGTAVVTATRNSDLLRTSRYASVREIGWGEAARAGPADIRGLEVNHWGARMRTDTWRGYNGYLIQVGRRRVLFAGDTAETAAFRRLPGGPVDLAILPIGAYNPWIHYHANPEQAWRMGNDARAEFLLPVHHQTFSLSREPFHEPIERFTAAAGRDAHRIVARRIGEEFRLA